MGRSILVTGGAGYIGSILVPKLLARHRVTVLDALWFGRGGLASVAHHDNLNLVEGDIRDAAVVDQCLANQDVVIHLAAVSNDPCSDLDADITRSVNSEATVRLMQRAKALGVRRFINASSASVYGIKQEPDVTEDLSLEPLTLYARYKAETEQTLRDLLSDEFEGVSVRAATVCGYSPRLRLDLTINILTYHALTKGEIRVFGGDQLRPNIHIQDLTDFYVSLVDAESAKINGQSFNVVRSNSSVLGLAEMIKAKLGDALTIRTVPTEDNRSYHLSGNKLRAELGFEPRHELDETIDELKAAFADGRIPDPDDYQYRNIEVMKLHPERCAFRT
jgi:nucleoside-diphosphate-sugar epimerase